MWGEDIVYLDELCSPVPLTLSYFMHCTKHSKYFILTLTFILYSLYSNLLKKQGLKSCIALIYIIYNYHIIIYNIVVKGLWTKSLGLYIYVCVHMHIYINR